MADGQPPMSTRQIVVLAAAAALNGLARESRIARLAGLASAEADFAGSQGVVGLDLGRLGAVSRDFLANAPGVDTERLSLELSKLFPSRSEPAPMVVLVFGRTRSLAAQVADLIDIVMAARQIRSFRELENPGWHLIAISETELGVAELRELEKLRQLRGLDEPDRESRLFARCWLCNSMLTESAQGQPVFARHVWPILVGRRIVEAAVSEQREAVMHEGLPWYWAWASTVVTAPTQEPLYEDAIISLMNVAMESIPTNGAPDAREPVRWSTPRLSVDRVPMQSKATSEGQTGYFPPAQDRPEIDFVACGPGAAMQAHRDRCDPNSTHWREVQALRSTQFRIDQDRLQCSPFGEVGKPNEVQQRIWEKIRRERGLLDHYAGAQALSKVELCARLGESHAKWEGVLDFEPTLAEGIDRAQRLAQTHDELREGFLAWWYRVTIAAAVALFVGFVMTSVVSTATGSLTTAVFVAGAVVSIAAIATMLVLWQREIRAGREGTEILERGLTEVEQGISRSLLYRLMLLFESSSMRSESIWMSTSVRNRLLARRARQVLEMLRSEVFASRRTMLERAGAEGALSLKAFLAGSESPVVGLEGDACRRIVDHLERTREDPKSAIAELIDRHRRRFSSSWNEFCAKEDPELAGHLTVRGMRREFEPILGEIRSDVEQQCAKAILESMPDAKEELLARLRRLSKSVDTPPLMSVRTSGYRGGSVKEEWRVFVAAELDETIHRVMKSHPIGLPAWSGILLLAHIDFPLVLEERGIKVDIREARSGSNDDVSDGGVS